MYQKIRITYHIFVCAILLGVCDIAISQTGIKGIINDYAGVTAISPDGLTVTLSDVSMFTPANLPDTVLLIQMTGIVVTERYNPIWNNAGNYAFHIVESVSGQSVTLRWPIAANTFSPGTEFVQMVRVPSYKNAQINDVLTCEPWDWESGTGGVLALFVNDALTFNANIDVSGKGFAGGKVSGDAYAGSCVEPDVGYENFNIGESSVTAGYKGEGAIARQIMDDTPKGWGRTWNGGGGGLGKWSGGGGGANSGGGGPGDLQACLNSQPVDDQHQGNAGYAIRYSEEDQDDSFFWSKRAFLGGGGGSGTGEDATRGGNGGGIVMIVANRLHFSPNTAIKANGESVAGIAMYGGAGGGGAGGGIFLSVEDYGDIKAEVNGGNGGNVYVKNCNEDIYSKGSGGGGGGGLIFTTGSASQPNEHYEIRSGQMGGPNPASGCVSWWGGGGTEGLLLDDFQVQLKGFLNNYIFDSDTVFVCYNEKKTIRASKPIVTAEPDYAWQYSTDEGNTWKNPDIINSPVAGDSTQFNDGEFRFSQSGALKLRRVVKLAAGTVGEIIDKSKPVTVFVRAPVDNAIMPPDTVCRTKSFLITGNDLSVSYLWEEAFNGNWRNPEGMNTGCNLSVEWPNSDVKQIYRYRRIAVSSFGCKDTSLISDIHVYPEIKNNTVTPDEQSVCENNTKTLQSLKGQELAGGDFPNYHYQWQFRTDDSEWSDIPGAPDKKDCDTSFIRPLQNYDEYNHYRRIVTSGVLVTSGKEVCKDTSATVKVKIDRMPYPPRIAMPGTDLTGDSVLAFRFRKELIADRPTTGNGVWSSPDDRLIFEPPDQPETTVSNLQKGNNIIYWTVSNGGCPSSSFSRTIEVKIPATIGFSPNGDKKNDCFMIPAVKDADKSELIIFDRYKNVVFKQSFKGKSNLNCLWDGNDLPSGTYIYQLTIDGNQIFKGYVVLKRQ